MSWYSANFSAQALGFGDVGDEKLREFYVKSGIFPVDPSGRSRI